MINETKKCEKCGQPLKQSGLYAHDKPQGAPAYKGPDEINFWCTNESCENYNKTIQVIE